VLPSGVNHSLTSHRGRDLSSPASGAPAGRRQTTRSTAGAVEVLRYGLADTSIAAVLVALSDKGVAAIAIREHPDPDAQVLDLQALYPRACLQHDPVATKHIVKAVVDFVEHPQRDLDLPLDIRGTAFQRQVWDAVLKIPFGETTTFAEIAKRVGSPRAVRAVGSACTRNPLEFAIPCHRVLRSDGSYSGGSPWGDRRQARIVRREAECHHTKYHVRRPSNSN
jgi:AraC family transcriptional regulator, regulatory protein of adaptative response / methylated-DNA-[protein]-cysteine methyltransferase